MVQPRPQPRLPAQLHRSHLLPGTFQFSKCVDLIATWGWSGPICERVGLIFFLFFFCTDSRKLLGCMSTPTTKEEIAHLVYDGNPIIIFFFSKCMKKMNGQPSFLFMPNVFLNTSISQIRFFKCLGNACV